jgi:hypothetical protein
LNSRVVRLVALAAAVGLIVALFAAATSSATASKPFSIVVAPGTVSTGTAAMTATLKNETGTQQFGSANLFWPSPLQVLSASLPAGAGSATLASSCTYGSLTGPCVQLRNLSLPPAGTVVVTMNVSVPAGCSAAPVKWAIEAKQANDFSGQPGNDMTLDAANSSLATIISGACAVRFGTQPHSAVTGQVISGTDYDPSGPPVTVDVVDVNGNIVTGSTAAVTVALGSNPGGATLSGTTTVNAAGGVATFSTLTLDKPADGYTLTASSLGLTGATSNTFSINDQALICTAQTINCAVDTGNSGGDAKVVAHAVDTGLLLESVNANGGGQLTCSGYTTNDPNTYTFDTTSSNWSKVVTITIHDPANTTTSGAAHQLGSQDLCLQAPYPFTTKSGRPATKSTLPDGSVVYTGLLPNCPQAGGPCHNRGSDKKVSNPSSPTGWDIILVADFPAGLPGDPRMN